MCVVDQRSMTENDSIIDLLLPGAAAIQTSDLRDNGSNSCERYWCLAMRVFTMQITEIEVMGLKAM